MSISRKECCVLNGGSGAWAFEPLAIQLSSSLGIDVSDRPRRFNYLLHVEDTDRQITCHVFIPTGSVRIASDKRLLAKVFIEHGVPTPETHLLDTYEQVLRFVREHPGNEWCLKYPTSCGANGHRLIAEVSIEPPNWPRPFILQEFVRLERPEVYRTYCAGGELFGWVARRFPEGARLSPWIAHARGARYVRLAKQPAEAREAARRALMATGLLDSFGCADLLRKPTGEWVVLEIGTDGLFNHVDRDLGDKDLEQELHHRVAKAFWRAAERLDPTGRQVMPSECLKIEYLGTPCPVEAWGTVDGDQFYFRSRWDRWSFAVSANAEIDPTDIELPEQGYLVQQPYGGFYGAGYMPEGEARKLIERCAREYYAQKHRAA